MLRTHHDPTLHLSDPPKRFNSPLTPDSQIIGPLLRCQPKTDHVLLESHRQTQAEIPSLGLQPPSPVRTLLENGSEGAQRFRFWVGVWSKRFRVRAQDVELRRLQADCCCHKPVLSSGFEARSYKLRGHGHGLGTFNTKF